MLFAATPPAVEKEPRRRARSTAIVEHRHGGTQAAALSPLPSALHRAPSQRAMQPVATPPAVEE
jgi:hypothetical protein